MLFPPLKEETFALRVGVTYRLGGELSVVTSLAPAVAKSVETNDFLVAATRALLSKPWQKPWSLERPGVGKWAQEPIACKTFYMCAPHLFRGCNSALAESPSF